MFTEESIVDQITAQWLDAVEATATEPAVPARWVINVRRSNRVLRDGKVISKEYHRHVVELNDDLMVEDPMVREVAKTIKRERG